MQTVILCGGKGTRAYPHTEQVPKPLLEVAHSPIVEHVMRIYAAHGHKEFVLAAGYRGDMLVEWARGLPADWQVDVVDTGLDTNTGGRVWALRDRVEDEFFVTYADGLGNVDLSALIARHRSHPGSATMTTVPLRSQYGTVEYDDAGQVERFLEKPVLPDRYINAGFFAFDRSVFDHWAGEDLERDVLPGLAQQSQLFIHHHPGFWRSMDTHKDALELTALCEAGVAPWDAPLEHDGSVA
jgi:glucose-1-phosphate cytidylyltransferase